jgi:predicted TPR repeat methyltransferase
MLAEAARSQRYSGLRRFDLNNFTTFFDDSHYSIVAALGVCEFIEDLPNFLKAAHTALLPKGELWITLEESSKNETTDYLISKKTYEKIEAETLLSRAGFEVVNFERNNGYFSKRFEYLVPYLFIRCRKVGFSR